MQQKTTSRLSKLIKSKKAKVGIVGMGYVGSALAEAVKSGGFSILGFDIDSEKVAKINSLGKKNFQATENIKRLEECDVIAICDNIRTDQSCLLSLNVKSAGNRPLLRFTCSLSRPVGTP